MKKVIYIAFAVFALGMVSCSKQDIKPNSSSDVVVPVWKSLDSNNENTNGGSTVSPITDPELGGTDSAPITDPELGV